VLRSELLRKLLCAPPCPRDDDERAHVTRHVVETGKDPIHEIKIDLPEPQRIDAAESRVGRSGKRRLCG